MPSPPYTIFTNIVIYDARKYSISIKAYFINANIDTWILLNIIVKYKIYNK